MCVEVCMCVCRGLCVGELLFAVEETLKWFVPFGALQHLGEHSLNYARSSVIVPLSRLRFTHLSLPLSPCPCALACPRSVRFATLRDLSFTHANLTANCQEQERQLKWFAVCDCLWKGTMTLPAESRAHTQKRCSMAFFLWRVKRFLWVLYEICIVDSLKKTRKMEKILARSLQLKRHTRPYKVYIYSELGWREMLN